MQTFPAGSTPKCVMAFSSFRPPRLTYLRGASTHLDGGRLIELRARLILLLSRPHRRCPDIISAFAFSRRRQISLHQEYVQPFFHSAKVPLFSSSVSS